MTVAGDAREELSAWAAAWQVLAPVADLVTPMAVRVGAPYWRHLAANPALNRSFDELMAGGDAHVADAAEEYDWSGVRHVVDVGGGTGALLAAVLGAHPRLRGTLVDLPDTVERGRSHLAERGLGGRCAFAGQSFFDPLPAGGDVYVLGRVLHDWSDEEAVRILRRCAEAGGGAGRVIVIESNGGPGDDPAAFAAEAGLEVAGVRGTPRGHVLLEYVARR